MFCCYFKAHNCLLGSSLMIILPPNFHVRYASALASTWVVLWLSCAGNFRRGLQLCSHWLKSLLLSSGWFRAETDTDRDWLYWPLATGHLTTSAASLSWARDAQRQLRPSSLIKGFVFCPVKTHHIATHLWIAFLQNCHSYLEMVTVVTERLGYHEHREEESFQKKSFRISLFKAKL